MDSCLTEYKCYCNGKGSRKDVFDFYFFLVYAMRPLPGYEIIRELQVNNYKGVK